MDKNNDKTAERKIDEEIARRAPNIHVFHIIDEITDLIRNINGITIVTDMKVDYGRVVRSLRNKYIGGTFLGVFPGDVKAYLIDSGYTGVAICDRRDQFSRQEGRTRAKRNWLRTHPYTHPRVKSFRELRRA